ncbi:putative lipid II flippase FtsW [Caproicibacterium lactatifermentans]|uniref:Probable peptidoglycan glycosyltransferase FtsW n=2 Tax=Oscillospiraceae TaxID=216572 RepID=A0A859DST7_9FIRM|nr:putative lipid II flippase FtsW [Caproicibacterium lactatifermentans]QKO31134.1 putative lipid II flippase FtsW [Caproicibacterium lactatifermentans]
MLSVRSGMDLTFFFLVLVLVAFGLVMVFSASYANSSYRYGTPYHFVINQAIYAVIGMVIMVLLSYFDYHHLHRLALPIYIITALLLGITVVFKGSALVRPTNGAYRWITIGSFQFQPSEIAKFALILLLAHLLSNRDADLHDKSAKRFRALIYVAAIGVICALVVAEKHMSATIILLLLAAIMLFVGGLPKKWFIIGGIVVVGALLIVANLPYYAHVSTRMEVWKNPWNPQLSSNDAWQTQQSLYAIGSGRLLGLGLGKSRQKYLYLPEPQNDFIFAIVCEELGFIGAVLIIVLFALLVWRGVMIALRAKDRFGMLLGIGLIMQVGLQVVLNIAVVTNTIPNTGVSLPFFSAGGTSLVMLLAQMGLILSISRTSNIEKS